MKTRTICSVRLPQLFRDIRSVVVTNGGHYGRSLAIVTSDCEDHADIHLYRYDLPYNLGMYYIPIGKFSYKMFSNIPISADNYKNIVIRKLEVTEPSAGAGFKFVRASLTKKLIW